MTVLYFYMLSALVIATTATEVAEEFYTFNASLDVVFNFYSRQNQNFSQIMAFGNASSLLNSNFMMNKSVAILVHGLNGDADDEFNRHVRKAILNSMDINVISVDWCVGAQETYKDAFENIPSTATEIVKFINWLKGLGVKNSDLRLVGFSMGGQMVGFVARGMDQKLPYVMALDPAAPWFGNNTIKAGDADYVEIIHTSPLGITHRGGHNDFYPNKGISQTGCTDDGCNHFRSYLYLAESLAIGGGSRFIGQSCRSVQEAMTVGCNSSRHLHLGGLEPKRKLGVLYLETNPSPPFAKG